MEEDGVVIYDESDDYSDDELYVQDENGKYRQMTNEDIFTDEYMQEFDRKMDAEFDKEKRQQHWVSVGVILGCIMTIGLITLLVVKLK